MQNIQVIQLLQIRDYKFTAKFKCNKINSHLNLKRDKLCFTLYKNTSYNVYSKTILYT